jgi:hypothetical protein
MPAQRSLDDEPPAPVVALELSLPVETIELAELVVCAALEPVLVALAVVLAVVAPGDPPAPPVALEEPPPPQAEAMITVNVAMHPMNRDLMSCLGLKQILRTRAASSSIAVGARHGTRELLQMDHAMECSRCGACCVAPDIAALDKPLGVRCPHLTAENLCAVYDRRPEICRRYEPDDLCRQIEAPTLPERVHRYLAVFGLVEEAERVRSSCTRSMGAARRTPRDEMR